MTEQRHPRRFRWTVRLRLTLLYGALFLATGVLLLAVTYMLVAYTPSWAKVTPPRAPELTLPSGGGPVPPVPSPSVVSGEQVAHQRADDLRQLFAASGIALALMTFVSVGLGWLMAGRVLRPLRAMAVTAKSISASDLHRRLHQQGPADEIKELADTFDTLLDHLQGAFEAQRRFVANASHELRTPLTFERSLLEVALADPDATAADLRDACRRVLSSNQQQGKLIEALLTLARSQRGLDRRTQVDLATLTDALLDSVQANAVTGLRIEADLHSAPITGDPPLVERLIANLVDNATRHNVTNGWVTVWTGIHAGRPTLRVRNTGPVILPAQVDTLVQPFQRLDATRTSGQDGFGIGLSIVAAIATAHDAELHAQPLPHGGLDVRTSFPRATTGSPTEAASDLRPSRHP
jgi:signal transduction histidine kinase